MTKRQKKAAIAIDLPRPSFANTLPVQIPRFLWTLLVSIPAAVSGLKVALAEAVERYRAEPEPEAAEEEAPARPARGLRRRKFVVPDGPTFEAVPVENGREKEEASSRNQPAPLAGGLWTDEDLIDLVQLINKHPGGTPGRWEVIAESLGRSVPEVTFMANKVIAAPSSRKRGRYVCLRIAGEEQRFPRPVPGGRRAGRGRAEGEEEDEGREGGRELGGAGVAVVAGAAARHGERAR